MSVRSVLKFVVYNEDVKSLRIENVNQNDYYSKHMSCSLVYFL